MTARDNGGIRTLADLQARCRLDEDTDCWLWAMAVTHDKQPRCIAWLSPELRVQTTAGRVAWAFFTGQPVPSGRTVYRRISCPKLCCNPRHLRVGTKTEAYAPHVKSGRLRGDPRRAAINARNRASASTKLNYEKAQEIRVSDESTAVLALRYGVSRSTILEVVSGVRWKPSAAQSPFAELLRLAA